MCQIPGEMGSLEYCSAIVESKERLKDGVRGMKGWLEKWPVSVYNAISPPSTGQVSVAAFPPHPPRHCTFSLPVSSSCRCMSQEGPWGLMQIQGGQPKWEGNPEPGLLRALLHPQND